MARMQKKIDKKGARKKAPSAKRADRAPVVPPAVRFYYLKSSQFRVVHVDGAHGGLTPRGQIQMALFNERQPIPQQTLEKLTPEGGLGDEIKDKRIQKEGLIREVEVEAIMTLESAKSLVTWLQQRIDLLQKLRADTQARKRSSRNRT